MDPYNQQQNQHQQWYDPNQGAYQGQGYAPMTPQNYPPPVPQFQPQGDSDEDEEYDEERLTQAERELSEDAPWKKIQQNTFTRWVNEKLKAANDPNLLVENLQTDFKDGIKLARLVEILADKKIVGVTKKAKIQIQQFNNITAVLEFLKHERIDLVTIDSSHINAGNMKLILALIWALILHYSIALARWNDEDDLEQSKGGRERLLKWMDNYVTGHYAGPKINNFNKDWNDGTKLGALVDSKAPGLCPDWDEWNPENAYENANTAMDLAQSHLDVPKLIAPEEIISPSVDDKAVMTYLSQFPKAKPKPDTPLKPFCKPKRARAFGPGVEPQGCVVNQETHFTVETYGAGQGTVQVTVWDPNSIVVVSHVTFNNDYYKTYRVVYTPKKAGLHRVEVKWSGMDIKDSPFPVNVAGVMGDASKCRAVGPGLAVNGLQAQQPTHFDILTDDAGSGAVEVFITDPNGKPDTVQMRIDRDSPTKYNVKYLAALAGPHSIKVTFNGRHIPGSPFTVNMGASTNKQPPRNDPRKVLVTGRGVQPKGLREGEPAVFSCFTKDAGQGELTISVLGPSGVQVPCTKDPKGNGEFECVYYPNVAGPYKVIVHFGGVDVPRSPFQVKVEKASTLRVVAYGPGLYGGQVGQPAAFTVDTRGEPDANLGFSIEGPSEAQIDAQDNRDGSCKAKYFPMVPGDYLIHITCNNEDIKDSPFNARITPADTQGIDLSQVRVTGPGVEAHGNSVNKTTQVFIIFPPNTPMGVQQLAPKLKVLVIDRDGEYVPTSMPQLTEQSPAKFLVTYTPVKDQKHTVYVTVLEVSVAESPYQVHVDRGYDLSTVRVLNLEPEVFVEGYHDFIVDARGQMNRVGDEEVRVVIVAPSGKKTAAKVKPNGDGTYDVGYVLKEVGPHSIEVNYQGAPIPNSPFRVNASKGRDAARVTAVGPGLREGVVGKEAHFTVISKNAGPGSLGVYIEGPSEAKTTFKDNKDGTCSLAYLPTKPGEYNITIKYEDEFIPNSPFHAMIYPSESEMMNKPDPALVKVNGPCIKMSQPGSPIDHPAIVFASEPQQFVVDASQTGVAPMRCNITDPENRELPTQVADNRNGTFNVQWTPEDVGPHSINVSYGGQPVSNSPFPVQAKPTGNPHGVIAPDIKKVIPVNQEYPFTVDASKAGRGNITCSADGPDGRRYPVLVHRRPNQQIYDCRFRPHLPGNYRLNIKFGGNHVQGSPFQILATDKPGQYGESPISPAYANPNQAGKPFSPMGGPGTPNQPFYDEDPMSPSSRPNANQQPWHPGGPQGPGAGPSGAGTPPKAPVPQVGQKTPTEINVAPENIQPGQKLPPNAMTGEITTPSKRKMAPLLKNNDDETFAVDFAPLEVGKHQLAVRQNGRDIRDSPFTFFVDSVEPNRMSAYGPGLTAGVVFKPCFFTVITKNVRNPGGLKVTVQGPSRVDVQCTDKGDGTCLCQYTPTVPGEYQIDIFHDGKPLHGSPFFPKIQDPFNQVPQSPMSQAPAFGTPQRSSTGPKGPGASTPGTPGSERVPEVGESTPCQVKVAPDNIHPGQILPEQSMTGEVTTPLKNKAKPKLRVKDDGTFALDYVPTELGKHQLHVKQNGNEIKDSPFFFNVDSINDGKMSAYGPGLTAGIVNKVCYFTVLTKHVRNPGGLRVSVQGPAPTEVKCTDQGDGTCLCEYVPLVPGVYQVEIFHESKPLNGSPFQPKIQDPYNEAAKGPGAERPSNLFDQPYADEDPLSPSKKPGANQRPYYPGKPGTGTPGQNQPFSPSAAPGVGPGPGDDSLPKAPTPQVGQKTPCEVNIAPDDVAPGQKVPENCLSGEITTPSKRKTVPRVHTNSDGAFGIDYVPSELGKHHLTMRQNGKDLKDSPFTFNVDSVNEGKMSAYGPGLTAGVVNKPCYFTILTKTVRNPGALKVSIKGPSQTDVQYFDNNDGTCLCKYVPTVPGEYEIEIFHDGKPLNGSPFKPKIQDPHNHYPRRPGSQRPLSSGPSDQPYYDEDPLSPSQRPNSQQTPYRPMGSDSFPKAPVPNVGQKTPCEVNVAPENVAPGQKLPENAVVGEITTPSKRKAVPKLHSNDDGTFGVDYVPSEVGKHQLTIRQNGKEIKDSPFFFNVDSIADGKMSAYGPGLTSGIVFRPCYFTVLTKTVRNPGGLRVSVQGPSPTDVKCTDNGDGTCLCEYVPLAPGTYNIEIFADGKPLNGSPFTAKIQDPLNEAARGPGSQRPHSSGPFDQPYCDEDTLSPSNKPNVHNAPKGGNLPKAPTPQLGQKTPCEVNIAPDNVVPGQRVPENAIVGELTTPSKRKAAPKLHSNDDGTFGIDFKPSEIGPHELAVRQNGREIKDSPFLINVDSVDDGKMSAYGPGLTSGIVFRPCYFTILTKNVRNPGDLRVAVQGPAPTEVKCFDNGDGTCLCEYVPMTPGEYQIQIFHEGKQLNGSPFKPKIQDPFNEAARGPGAQKPHARAPSDQPYYDEDPLSPSSRPNAHRAPKTGSLPKAPTPQLGQKTPCEVNIAPDNVMPGQKVPENAIVGELTTPSKRKAAPKLHCNDDGTFGIDYKPSEVGPHELAVRQNGREIKDSPFLINVDSVDDGKMSAYGPGLTSGIVFRPCYFTVLTKNVRNPGGLRVSVQGPAPTDVKCTDNGDGTCLCEYVPIAPGVYQIEVFHDGKPLNGSPFTAKIQDPYHEAARGPGAQKPQMGSPFDQPFMDEDPMSPSRRPDVHRQPFYPGQPGPRGPGTGPQSGEPVPQVGQNTPCQVNVAPENVAPGQIVPEQVMTGEVTTPSNRKAVPRLVSNDDGTFAVDYIPAEVGHHVLAVRQNGKELDASPFSFNVDRVSDGQLSAYGPGLTSGIVNRPCYFTVITKTAPMSGGLRVSVQGPSRVEVQCTDNGDGTCTCHYVPTAPGEYQVEIFSDGKPINGSPFTPKIQDPYHQTGRGPAPFRPKSGGPFDHPYADEDLMSPSSRPGINQQPYYPGKPTAGTPGTPGQNQPYYPEDALDSSNRPGVNQQPYYPGQGQPASGRPQGPGRGPRGAPTIAPQLGQMTPCAMNVAPESLTPGQIVPEEAIDAEITTPSKRKAKPKVHSNDDGTISVNYVPSELGKHQMTLKQNGKEIGDSPFYFYVDIVTKGKVFAYGPGLTSGIVNQPCFFTVSTKTATGPGGLKVSVQGPSRVEVQCTDNGDGTCQCQFTPTAPGDYQIEIYFDGKPVNGSPFVSKVQDPFSPAKQAYIPMGSESRVTLKISEPDISVLNATIKPPSGNEEPCKLMRMANGSIGVSFTPKEVGEHLVNVFKNGQHIPNSPFKITVSSAEIGDASKVRVWGPGTSKATTNEVARFNIDMSDAGYSNLSLSMEGPSQANLDCTDTENGYCEVTYMPTEPGDYILNIKYGDKHVPGSPFNVHVTGVGSELKFTEKTSKTRRSEAQLADIGNSCELSLSIPGASPSDMSAQVISPTGKVEPATIGSDGRNKFQVSFVPEENGIHQVHVYHKDREIQGSPFQFTVGPLEDQGAAAVKAYGPGLQFAEANQPAEFVILTREAGGGSLSVAVEGPSKTDIELEDNKDGSCNILYYPTLPGEYQVNIKFNDQHIPNSPYKVQVVPGSAPIFPQPDAGLLPNEPASFVVTLPNVQSAREIEPRLVCPSGREVPCEVLRIDNQGNYAIKFVPTEDGDHRVDVYVWGAHVPGSPFLFKVGHARGDPTRVFADGPGLYQGETGKPCEFIVNTCNAGKGTLQVTVDGPSRVTMDCQEVEEGYSVSYVPYVPGEYVITIKYAGAYHINGSPFRASITGRAEPSYAAEQYITQQEVVTVDTVAKTRYSLFDQAANKKRVETSPGADADKVVCRGPALKRAQSNIMNSFQVDTSNAGESMLLIGCHGPTLPADEIIVKHVGSGRYDVRFKPAQPGDHVIAVKWNDKHVAGSPFLVICT